MSDSAEFQDSYRATVAQTLARTWPAHWLANYEFDSLLKDADGKEVYLARDQRNNAQVVLRATAADAAERADAEWEILRKLDHAGIPKAFGCQVEHGRSFIAREYFPGASLDQVVEDHLFSVADTLKVARQLAEILDYLHRRNPPVIHRDLKPQNIIVGPNGSIGLTDFGIARTYKTGAPSDTVTALTKPYAAPEQWGYGQTTPRTDIYSLGIVLIYLLTGDPDRNNLAQRVADPELLAVIEKCIEFDPARRFPSAEQLLKRLDGLLQEHHHRRAVRIGVAVVAALAVVVTGMAIFRTLGPSVNAGPAVASVTSSAPASASPTGSLASFAPSAVPSSALSSSPASAAATPLAWGTPLPPLAGFPSIPAPPHDGLYLGSGNYPGNLNNTGLAVAGDDAIYVATAAGLTVLSFDGHCVSAFAELAGAKSLNYYQGQVYLRQGDDVIRLDPRTGTHETLFSVSGEHLFIDGGRLYYDDGSDHLHLYTATLEGDDRALVNDAQPIYSRQVSAGWMIYSLGDDTELTFASLTTDETYQPGYRGSYWHAVWNGQLYVMNEDNELHRIDLATGADSVIARQHYDFMVATDLGLFGLSTAAETLDLITADGRLNTLVPERTGYLCVAGDWVFYQQGGLSGPLRMVRADGTDDQPLPTAG